MHLLVLAGVLFITLLGIYYPLLTAPNFLLDFDDQQLVQPLKDIFSWADYFKARQESHVYIMDVAPVRDLSFWLDTHLGFNYHLHNFLIWIICLILFYGLLRQLTIKPPYALAATALLGLHPITVDTVGWIAARKHLLSMAFTLLATCFLIKAFTPHKRSGIFLGGTLICYLLANLAWTINVLWPFLAMALVVLRPRFIRSGENLAWHSYLAASFLGKKIYFWAILHALMLLLMAVNFYYYRYIYLIHSSGHAKFEDTIAGLGAAVISLGRHLFQALVPLWPSPTPLSVNFTMAIAALLLVPLLFWAIRQLPRWMQILGIIWSTLNLLLVCISTTNTFACDTYLLMPLAGMIFLLAAAMQNLLKRASLYLLLVLIPLYAFISGQQVFTWQSNLNLWSTALARDDNPQIIGSYAQYYLDAYPTTAYPYFVKFFKKYPYPQQSWFLAYAIAHNQDLTLAEKLALLDQEGAWGHYFKAALAAEKGDWATAYQNWLTILENEQTLKELNFYPNDLAIAVAEGSYFCRQSGHAPQLCQKQVEYVQGLIENFDEKSFQKRDQELR